MKTIAIITCKFIRLGLRLLGRGGTSLPGKVALRLCPNLLGHVSKGVKTIVITGTNGKTTSARIVEQAFIDTGKSYFSNKSGANLIHGITADFVSNCSIFGKPKKEYAVIECDEGALKNVLRQLKPQAILVTNVFRDQLDRFGEVTSTLECIRAGIENVPDTVMVLNADCSLTASLKQKLPNECVFYGVDKPIYKTRVDESSDAPFCLNCGTEYEYDYITYGHLGGYRCPKCGYKRPAVDYSVSAVTQQTADWSEIQLRDGENSHTARINLPGGFNIYNAIGAYAALKTMGFDSKDSLAALEGFSCGFGRMERFDIGDATLRMILVKNPAGCNQVLNFLTNLDGDSVFAICLNDGSGDGTDVSWIWDVNFEELCSMGDSLKRVLVSGNRADDMALRMAYSGIDTEKIAVYYDYDALIDEMVASKDPVFIMPNYTSMLELRSKLASRFGFKNFWE